MPAKYTSISTEDPAFRKRFYTDIPKAEVARTIAEIESSEGYAGWHSDPIPEPEEPAGEFTIIALFRA